MSGNILMIYINSLNLYLLSRILTFANNKAIVKTLLLSINLIRGINLNLPAVFFFGLLSTPLPYLLLAAFYFFGFAMGVFNNSTGDESVETVAAVTIPVETKQKVSDNSTFYYQINADQIHVQADVLKSEETFPFFPDTGAIIYDLSNVKVHELLFPGFQFSRPPPVSC